MRFHQAITRSTHNHLTAPCTAIQAATRTGRANHTIHLHRPADGITLCVTQLHIIDYRQEIPATKVTSSFGSSHNPPRRAIQLCRDGNSTATLQPHLQHILVTARCTRDAAIIQAAAGTQQLGFTGDKHINAGNQRQPLGRNITRHVDVQTVMHKRHSGRLSTRKTPATGSHGSSDAVGIDKSFITHSHRITHPQVGVIFQPDSPPD